ncbi:hypothetical protein OG866_12350 [Streptomyces sp. NBC_00663]
MLSTIPAYDGRHEGAVTRIAGGAGYTVAWSLRNSSSSGSTTGVRRRTVICVVPGRTASRASGISDCISAACSTRTKSESPMSRSTGDIRPRRSSAVQGSGAWAADETLPRKVSKCSGCGATAAYAAAMSWKSACVGSSGEV